MNQINKLYENTGIEYEERYSNCTLNKEGECKLKCSCDICKYSEEIYIYPPFTAEKQIELIKVLLKNYEGIDISKKINRFNFLVDNATFIGCHHNDKSFEESLAGVINKLWADMSEEEKQQIKGILEKWLEK